MAIIAICNHKGGTGKTTTSVNVAAALSLVGYKTLVIDLDPQAFLTRNMDIEPSDTVHSSLNLFESGKKVSDLEVLHLPSFDLLPSGEGMNYFARKLTGATDIFWIQQTLSNQDSYSAIILDTAAALSVFSLNALVAADILMIPVTPEPQPVAGAEQTYATATEVRGKWNPNLKAAMFLLTNVHGRKNIHLHYSKYLREKYGSLVMDTFIRTSSYLTLGCENGKTIFDTHLSSRGAIDYAGVVDELIQHVLDPMNLVQNGQS